jgi:hypothetical protein
MPLDVCGDKTTARDNAQSLGACVIERSLCELIADTLTLQLQRDLRVSEHDGPVATPVLTYGELSFYFYLELILGFVVRN